MLKMFYPERLLMGRRWWWCRSERRKNLVSCVSLAIPPAWRGLWKQSWELACADCTGRTYNWIWVLWLSIASKALLLLVIMVSFSLQIMDWCSVCMLVSWGIFIYSFGFVNWCIFVVTDIVSYVWQSTSLMYAQLFFSMRNWFLFQTKLKNCSIHCCYDLQIYLFLLTGTTYTIVFYIIKIRKALFLLKSKVFICIYHETYIVSSSLFMPWDIYWRYISWWQSKPLWVPLMKIESC